MINRRRVIRFVGAALTSAWLFHAPAAHADQAFQRFFPLLVDLDGWQGKKSYGMSMETSHNSMITATRDYQRGTAELHAGLIIGPAAVGTLAATVATINVETSDGHMITSKIDGLPVTKAFNVSQKSGAIFVALGASALFGLLYNGITEDEAITLAEKFDWKAMQAAAQSK
jgi:hypothetical protein